MAFWDYKAHGSVYSNVSDDQIRSLIAGGTITRDTPITRAGTEKWQSAGSSDFRRDCERADNGTYRASRAASVIADMPKIGSARIGFAAFLWIAITVIGLLIAWHEAESYNPNNNGTYSVAEAAMFNAGWTQVIAQFISAGLLFSAFATFAIVGRLTLIARINRAGHIAVVEEVRALRASIEQGAATAASHAPPA